MGNLYVDKMLIFSDGQAVTGSTESNNVLDMGVKEGSAGGKMIDLRITEDFTGGASLQFVLQDSDNGTSFNDIVTTPSFNSSQLKGNGKEPLYSIAIPKHTKRFLRVKYAVSSGSFTKGKVSAVLNTDCN